MFRRIAFLATTCMLSIGVTLAQRPPCNGPGNGTDWTWDKIPPSRNLRWFGCFGEENLHCARLDVPMDWQDPRDDQRVVLAIIRRPARNRDDYRGPVIVNPGGTGGSGVFYVKTYGAYVQSVVGDNYDIVSFDPRGIGASTPRYECFNSSEARTAWSLQDPGIIDAHPDLSLAGTLYTRALALNRLCEQNVARTGLAEHSGTTYVVRDMLALVDQTGYDDIAFWGFSYGTVIGNLFAAMYPDRVRLMLNDANVDTDEWFLRKTKNFLANTETVMTAFYYYCHDAGVDLCAFYESSPEAIEEKMENLFARLKEQPILVSSSDETNGPTIPELVTYSGVKTMLSAMLFQPYFEWPLFARILQGLVEGNGRSFYEYYHPPSSAETPICGINAIDPFEPLVDLVYSTPEAYGFMQCADGTSPRDATLEFVVEQAEHLIAWSPAVGAVNIDGALRCAGRTIAPKWRYDGPYGAITKGPILYVNNVADPITPLISAHNNAARFPGSVVLAQESYGHTFLAAPSDCTTRYINEYFQNGTLPANGTVCAGNWEPFKMVL